MSNFCEQGGQFVSVSGKAVDDVVVVVDLRAVF